MEMFTRGHSPERKERMQKHKTEAFTEFWDSPLMRMALSQMGDKVKQEDLRLLLSGAFDAGFACGGADMMSDIAGMIMEGHHGKGGGHGHDPSKA